MQAEVKAALQIHDRGRRLRRLETLAGDASFYDLAAIWAPALLEENAAFFEPFLQRHLPRVPLTLLRQLLPQIEAAGREGLFQNLYHLTVDQEQWNQELAQIAISERMLPEKLAAIRRRDGERLRWFRLDDETATHLYTLAPERLRAFLQQHVRGGWWGQQPIDYQTLQQAAEAGGDEEMRWHLFQELADGRTWKQELKRLYQAAPPAANIGAELEKRHPRYVWNEQPAIIIDFVTRYGQAVLPYVDNHLHLVIRERADDFLQALADLDEEIYWHYFFRVGRNEQWLAALRTLLEHSPDDKHLYRELQRRLPPDEQTWGWQRWFLDDELALAFYRRDPERFRPFLESFVDRRLFGQGEAQYVELFKEATIRGDEGFLNLLSFIYLGRLTVLALRQHSRWNRHARAEKVEIERLSNLLLARFDRLYATSPQQYVRHVADILARYQAFAVWNFEAARTENPAFNYLYTRHRPAWWHSAAGSTELLESPNIFIQIVGMEILAEGTATGHPEAAQRVLENLPILRALLLGRAHKSTKRLALQLLADATRTNPNAAREILPLLEETMSYHSRRAIADDIMVTYVRLYAAEQAHRIPDAQSPIPAAP